MPELAESASGAHRPSRWWQWLGAFSSALERRRGLYAALLLAFIVLSALGQSARRPFTYDEQISYRTALMPLRGVWSFYAQGLDTTGPVPSLLAHIALALPQSPEIAIRVPFIAAFAIMCWGLFSFLGQRYAAGFALAGLIIPLELSTLLYCRTDARAYALMLCAAGAGLRFWQMAAEGKARPWSVLGLWLVLALGVSAHFFAVFLFAPFALAQLVLESERKRRDLAVWGALLLFPLACLPLAPGAMRAHRLYAGTFWAKPALANLGDAYELMIEDSWPIIFVLCIFVFGLVLWHWRAPRSRARSTHAGLHKAEWVLILALLVLPLIVWAAAQLIGAYRYMYVITFAAGLTVALAAGVAELSGRKPRVGLCFFLLMAILAVADEQGTYAAGCGQALMDRGAAHRALAASFQSSDWARWLERSQLPVVADNDTYVRLAMYGSPALARRSFALTNLAAATTYPLAMTDQNNMLLFGERIGLQSQDINVFMRQHPRFILVQQRPHRSYEWMAACLLERSREANGPQMQVRYMDGEGRVFLYEVVSAPQ